MEVNNIFTAHAKPKKYKRLFAFLIVSFSIHQISGSQFWRVLIGSCNYNPRQNCWDISMQFSISRHAIFVSKRNKFAPLPTPVAMLFWPNSSRVHFFCYRKQHCKRGGGKRSVHTSANLFFHFSNKNGKRTYYLSLSYFHISKYRKKEKKRKWSVKSIIFQFF